MLAGSGRTVTCMFLLLIFLAHTLHKGKRESANAHQRNLGYQIWMGMSITLQSGEGQSQKPAATMQRLALPLVILNLFQNPLYYKILK